MRNNNYSWFTWILCCLFCNREKYNRIGKTYYKYGKTYSQKSYKKLFN